MFPYLRVVCNILAQGLMKGVQKRSFCHFTKWFFSDLSHTTSSIWYLLFSCFLLHTVSLRGQIYDLIRLCLHVFGSSVYEQLSKRVVPLILADIQLTESSNNRLRPLIHIDPVMILIKIQSIFEKLKIRNTLQAIDSFTQLFKHIFIFTSSRQKEHRHQKRKSNMWLHRLFKIFLWT